MNKKVLTESLFRLVKRHEVDVLILAECGLPAGQILEILNRESSRYHFPATIAPGRQKILIFTRFDGKLLSHIDNHRGFRWTMRQLSLPGAESILMVAVHMNSKLIYNDYSQHSEYRDLAEHIRQIEQRLDSERTFVVGDFNANPFEPGMFDAKALNTEPTRRKVLAKSRAIAGTNYPFFYNPMWNFFGDATRGPAGTFHYSSSQPARMAWNMFDQVLLRPQLLPFFRNEDLEILTTDTDVEDSFLTRQSGVPSGTGSDHLPIVFKLNL